MQQTPNSDYPEWFKNRKSGNDLIVSPLIPWAMVGLPVLVLIAIVIYPTIWMGYHAFQNTNMMSLFYNNYEYVGWSNFYNVITSERMHESIYRLIQYLIFGACLEVLLGTILALTLYEMIKNEFLKVMLLILMVMPMMLPPSIVGVLWKFLLQAYNGAINHLLINLGFLDSMERIE